MGINSSQARSLACLAFTSFLFYYDRGVVAIIIEPLKHDLRLDDAQVGIVTGFAFVILATVVAVPLANRADNVGRVLTLGWALVLWTVGTAFSALAMNIWVLMLARMCVGATEAVGSPNIHAITAESFPPSSLATAFGVIALAGNLGGASALMLGGFLSDTLGWRSVFWIACAAGVALTLLLWWTFQRDHQAHARRVDDDQATTLWEALGHFRKLPSFVYFAGAIAIASVGIFAFFTWVPALLMRKFGATAGEIGLTYGLIAGSASLVGPLLSGIVADRIAKNDPRRLLWLTIVLLVLVAPLTIAAMLAPTLPLAFAILLPTNLLLMGMFPPCYALTQHLSSPRFRTMGSTLLGTATTVVGLMVGPTLVGFLSEAFRPYVGEASLEYAVMASIVSYVIAAALMFLAIRHILPDLQRMNSTPAVHSRANQVSMECR